MSAETPDAAAVAALLAQARLPPSSPLEPVPHPGNNRVFHVASAPPALLKWYFSHPGDRRDRLGAEFSFSLFAWRRGLRALPEPLAADPPSRLALYARLPGRPLTHVDDDAVRQAAGFARELSAHRSHPEAAALPPASEACFSVDEHLRLLEARLERVARLEPGSGAREGARAFVQELLLPAARHTLASVRARAGDRATASLATGDRIVSPSDFGFHNALVDDRGVIRFFDFEYAGRDDPAKLACDFFCQPRIPVPASAWDLFAEAAGLTEEARRRARLLLPVYRLKWCCILLNDFLPEGGARRAFAGGEAPDEDRLLAQLEKARLGLRAATREAAGTQDEPGGDRRGGAAATGR